MTKERLTLNKRFLIIDSPIPFTLIANEGTDRVYRPAGAWQLNIWELLPEKFFKQYPVFNLEIEYDETLLEEDKEIIVRESDINLGTGLSGVNGQLVAISGDEIGLARESTLQSIVNNVSNIGKGVRTTIYEYFGFETFEDLYNSYSTLVFSKELMNKLSAKFSYPKSGSNIDCWVSNGVFSENMAGGTNFNTYSEIYRARLMSTGLEIIVKTSDTYSKYTVQKDKLYIVL